MSWCARHKVAAGVTSLVVVGAVALVIILLTMRGTGESPWETEYRLPNSVIPTNYDILLHPDLGNGTFTGFENIDLELTEDREYILIHAKFLEVTAVSLRPYNSTKKSFINIETPFEVKKNEWWVIKSSDKPFPKGLYTLQLKFSGSLTRNIVGFYRSVYKNAAGESRNIATSKFEPTYARLAFPCFDEPAMKAMFKVRLVRPSGENYTALSNANVQSTTPNSPGPGLTTVEFNQTVKMSTYVAVFIVCDFVHLDPIETKDKVPVKVYARKEQIHNALTALKVAVNATNYYVDYFKISYPMPKVDLIAIPDFVSGAMENWGLITFRETSMLFDPAENSPANEVGISNTVAHELAHMWFGNLVTMKWWTDLWLNEGFATFMSYKALQHIRPEWDIMTQFLTQQLHSVLNLDAVLSSHPIQQEVGHPDQITEIFDTISYNKGSSIIRMLESFMGEKEFAAGLRDYLEKHKYSNAETNDLWNALQSYAPSDISVSRVMNTWTKQMGYPLVNVTKTGPGMYTLTQKRFLADPDSKFNPSDSPYGYKWEIPITYVTSEGQDGKIWLSSNNESVPIQLPADTDWIKVNNLQTNYYRVLYDDGNWEALYTALLNDLNVLKPADRVQLINDAFSLADAQYIKYDIALNLSRYLSSENAFTPWAVASDSLHKLLDRLPESEPLKKYGWSLLNDIYNTVTWHVGTDDDHLKRRLRVTILDLACSMKMESALREANTLFMEWFRGEKKVHPDLRSVVYVNGMFNITDSETWDLLLQKYQEESNTQEKAKLMYALANTPSRDLLKRYMDAAKNESVVRSQDYFTVMGYIADNYPVGTQLVWDFYRNEWKNLVERFTLNDRVFGRFILGVTKKFSTQDRLKEIEDFFKKYPDAGAGTAARKQAVEMVKNNIKWLSVHQKNVEKWLKDATL